MPTISPTFENFHTKPVWYVYDQFTFDPLVEFQFPNKEVQYRRAFNHSYSMETFSGETPEVGPQPMQLGHAYAPTELRQAGRYKYFYFNQRNDVTSLLKHNGQSLHSYLYDEFGQLYDNNKKPKNASNFTDPHNHYTFSAKESDEESGLSYFGARYYDSWSGTWGTQDSYQGNYFDPQTINKLAQDIVDDILKNHGTTIRKSPHPRFGEIIEVRAPDGRGIQYDTSRNFIGFLEP